jgi:predicted DNA-binding protein (MmcQ/YjbR family)
MSSPSADAIRAVLAGQPGAVGDTLPSAKGVTLFKVMGKMFAVLAEQKTLFVMLKCDPHLAEVLRQQYAGVGHRTHLDRRFWIAVDLDSDVPVEEIARLAAHAYDLVFAKLTRKQKAELAALAEAPWRPKP